MSGLTDALRLHSERELLIGEPAPRRQKPRSLLGAVARWDGDRIVEEHVHYDLYGVLAQLGHVPTMDQGS